MAKSLPAQTRYYIDPDLLRAYPERVLDIVSGKKPGVVSPGSRNVIQSDPDYPCRDSVLSAFDKRRLIDTIQYPGMGQLKIQNDWGISPERLLLLEEISGRNMSGSNIKRIVLTSDAAFARIAKKCELLSRKVRPPSPITKWIVASFVVGGLTALLAWHQELLITLRFWIFLPISFLSVAAFWVRCRSRLAYGIAEIVFGVICVFVAAWGFDTKSLDPAIKLFGAIYIIVRGLDNIDQGHPIPSVKDGWKDRVWEKWEQWFSKSD